MAMMKTVTPENDGVVLEVRTNDLVEEVVDTLIQEAISHFNKLKTKVRDAEDDARYFYSDEELSQFMKGIIYPDKIWVSTITDDSGNFFAYRVGRIITTKKGDKKV